MRVLVSLGGGVWGRVQVGGGGGFPVKDEEKGGKGVGRVGWEGDLQRNWQVNAHAFVKNYPSGNYHHPLNRYMPEKMFGELIWAWVPDLNRTQAELIGKSRPCIRRSGLAVETLQRIRAKLFSGKE